MPNLYKYSPANSEIAFSSKWNSVSKTWNRQEEKLQIKISEDGYVHVEILTRGVASRVLSGFTKAFTLGKVEEIGVRAKECYAFKKDSMGKEEVIARISKIFQDHGVEDISSLKNSLIEKLVIPQRVSDETKNSPQEPEIVESKEPQTEVSVEALLAMPMPVDAFSEETRVFSLPDTPAESVSIQAREQSNESLMAENEMRSEELHLQVSEKQKLEVADINRQNLSQEEKEVQDYLNLLKMRLQEGQMLPEAIFKHQQQLDAYIKKLETTSSLVPQLREMKLQLANFSLAKTVSKKLLSPKERLAEIDYALTHMGVPEKEQEEYTSWMKDSKLHKVVNYAWDKFTALDLTADSIVVEDQADLALMAQWYGKLKDYRRELKTLGETVPGDEELQDEIWLQNRRIDNTVTKFDWLSLYFTECENAEKMLLAVNDQRYEQIVNKNGELFFSPNNLRNVIAQITVFMDLPSKYTGGNEQWKARIEKKCHWQINELMRGIEDFVEAILPEMRAEISESGEHLKEIKQVIRANKGTFFENLPSFYKSYLCLANIEKSIKEFDQFFQQVLLVESTKTSGLLSTLKKLFQEPFAKKEFSLEIRERLTQLAEKFKGHQKELQKARSGGEIKLCQLKLFFAYGKLNRKELLNTLENNPPEILMALKFLADEIDTSESDSAFYKELKEVGKRASDLLETANQLSHKQEVEQAQQQVLEIIKKLTTNQVPKEDVNEVNNQLHLAEVQLERVLRQTPAQQTEKQEALLAAATRAKRRVLTRSKKEVLKHHKIATYEAPDRPILGIVYFLMSNFASLIQSNMGQLLDVINANKPEFGVASGSVATVIRQSFSSSAQAMVSSYGSKDYAYYEGMARTFAETNYEQKFVNILDRFLKGERSGDFQGAGLEEFNEVPYSLSTINRWGWMHTRAYPGMLEEHFAAELQHFNDNPPIKVDGEELSQSHALYDMYKHVGNDELFENAVAAAREYGETAYVEKFKEYLKKRHAVLNPQVPLETIPLDTVLNGKAMLNRLAYEADRFKLQLQEREKSELILGVQENEIALFHKNLETLLKNSVTELDPKRKRDAWLNTVVQARDRLQEIKNIPQKFTDLFRDPVELLSVTDEMAGRVLLGRIKAETHSLEKQANSQKELPEGARVEQLGLIREYQKKLEDALNGQSLSKKKGWIDNLQEVVVGALNNKEEFLQTVKSIQNGFLAFKKDIEDIPKAYLYKEAISVAKFEAVINALKMRLSGEEEILVEVLGDTFSWGKEYPSDLLKLLLFQLEVVRADLDVLRNNAWCTSEVLSDFCRNYFENSYLKKMTDHSIPEETVNWVQSIWSYFISNFISRVNDLDKKLLEEPDYLLTYLEKAKARIETALDYEKKFKWAESWPTSYLVSIFFPKIEKDLMALPEGESLIFFDRDKGLVYEVEKKPEEVGLRFVEYGKLEMAYEEYKSEERKGESEKIWITQPYYEGDLDESVAWGAGEKPYDTLRRTPENYAAGVIRRTHFSLRIYDKNFDHVLEVKHIPGYKANSQIYFGNLKDRTLEWLNSLSNDWREFPLPQLLYDLRMSDEVPKGSIHDLASYIADRIGRENIEFPNTKQDFQPITEQNAPFQFLMSSLGIMTPQSEWEAPLDKKKEIENLEKIIDLATAKQVSPSEINQLRKAKDDLIKLVAASKVQQKLVPGFQTQKNRQSLLTQCAAFFSFHEKHKEFYAEEEAWRNLALKAGSVLAGKIPEYRTLGVIDDKLMEHILQQVQEVKNEVEKAARIAGIVVIKSKSQNLINTEKNFVSSVISHNSLPSVAPKGTSGVPEVYTRYPILATEWNSHETLQTNALRFFKELTLAKSAGDTVAVIEGLRQFTASAVENIKVASLDQESFIHAFTLFLQLSNEYVLAVDKFVGSKPITIEQILPQLQIITQMDQLQEHPLFQYDLRLYSNQYDQGDLQIKPVTKQKALNYEDARASGFSGANEEVLAKDYIPVFDDIVVNNVLNREFFTLNLKYATQFKNIKDYWVKKLFEKKKAPSPKAIREVLDPLFDKIAQKNNPPFDQPKLEENLVDKVLLQLRDVALGTHRLCYNYNYKLDIEKNAQSTPGTATSLPQLKLFEDPAALDQTNLANRKDSRLEKYQPVKIVAADEVNQKAAEVAQALPSTSIYILAQELEIDASSERAVEAISFGKQHPEFLAEEEYQKKFFRWIFEGNSLDKALHGSKEDVERVVQNINTFFQTAYTRHHNLEDFKTVSFVLLLGQLLKDKIEARAHELSKEKIETGTSEPGEDKIEAKASKPDEGKIETKVPKSSIMYNLMGNYLPEFLWDKSEKSPTFRDKWAGMLALNLPKEIKGSLWRDLAESYINVKSLSGAEAAQFMSALLHYKLFNAFSDWRQEAAEHEIEEFVKNSYRLFHDAMQKDGKEKFNEILNEVYLRRYPQATKLAWDIHSTYPVFVDEERAVEIDLKAGEIRILGQQTIEMPMFILNDPQFIEIFGSKAEVPITKAPADPLLPGSEIYILNFKRNYRIIKNPNEPLVFQAEFDKRWYQLLKKDEEDRLNFALEAPFKGYRKWYAFNPKSLMLEDTSSREISYRASGESTLKIEAVNNGVPTGFFVVQPTEDIIRIISPFEDVRQIIVLKNEKESSLAKIILPRYGFEFVANDAGELVWMEDFSNPAYKANEQGWLQKLKTSKESYSLATNLDQRGVKLPIPSDTSHFLTLERKHEDGSVSYKLIFPIASLLQTSDFLRSETEVDYESTLMDFGRPSDLYVQYAVSNNLSQMIPKNLNSKLYLAFIKLWKHGELDFHKAYQLLASEISQPKDLSPSTLHILQMIVNSLPQTRIFHPQAAVVRLKAALMILRNTFDSKIGIVKTIPLNKKQLLDDYLLYLENPKAVAITPLATDEEVLLFMAFRDELDMVGNIRHHLIWKRFQKEGVLEYFVNLANSNNHWKIAGGQVGKMISPSLVYPWSYNFFFNFGRHHKFLVSELTIDAFFPKTSSDLLATPEFQHKYALTRKYALAVKEWQKARAKYFEAYLSELGTWLPFPAWFESDPELANLITDLKKAYSYSAFWPIGADIAWIANDLNTEIKQASSLDQAKEAYLLMTLLDNPENFAEEIASLVDPANPEGRKLFIRQIIAPMRAAAAGKKGAYVGSLQKVEVNNFQAQPKPKPKGVLREYDDYLSNTSLYERLNAYEKHLQRTQQYEQRSQIFQIPSNEELRKDYYNYLEKVYPHEPKNIQGFRDYLRTAKGMSDIDVARYTHILDNARVPLPVELTFEIPTFLNPLPITESDKAQKAEIAKAMEEITNPAGQLDASVKKILESEQKAVSKYQAKAIAANYEIISLEALQNTLGFVESKLVELQSLASKLRQDVVNKANEIPKELLLLDKAQELAGQKASKTYTNLIFKYAKEQLSPELALMMRDSLTVENEVNYLKSLVRLIEKARGFELSQDTSVLAKVRKAQHLKELALELTRKVVYDVDKYRAFSAFENILGIRIRPEQLDLLYQLKIVNGVVTNPAFLNRALEAIMGIGKSFLIAPLFSFLNADGKRLAITIPPEALMGEMITDLEKSLGSAFEQIVEKMVFTRDTQLDAFALERILNRLRGCRTEQKTLVISIQSFFTLWLKWHEGREDPLNMISEFEDKLYAKIFDEFYTYGSALLDEVDLLLNINTRQLFAMGRGIKGGLDPVYKNVTKDIFTYLVSGSGKSGEILASLKDTKNHYQSKKELFVSEILENELKISDPAWEPFYESFSKNPEQRDFLSKFLLGKVDTSTQQAWKEVEDYIGGLAPQIRNILSILKEQINSLLPVTIPQQLYSTFGPNPVSLDKTSKDDQRLVCIPWDRGNPALPGTKFKMELEIMNLGFLERLYFLINPDQQNLGGITAPWVWAFLEFIRKGLQEDMKRYPNKPLEELEHYKIYEYVLGERIDEFPINAVTEDGVDKIVEIINQDPKKIIYMVDELAHKNLEIFPVQLEANPLLIGSLVGHKQGITGTLEHNVETFTETITDYQVSDTATEVLAASMKKMHEKIPSAALPDVRSEESVAEFFKAYVPAEPCVFIDTGNFLGGLKDAPDAESAFLDNTLNAFGTKAPLTPQRVAEIYLDEVQEKQIAKFGKILTTEVVIHDKYGAWVISKIPGDFENPSGPKIITKKPFTEAKVLNEGRSVIFLQFKTTGTDIKLLDTMQAVVTISKDMKLRDLHQGIYRLRQIAEQQSVTYLTSHESANYIASVLREIDGVNFTRGQNKDDSEDDPLITQDYMRYLLIHQAQKRVQDNVRAFKLKFKAAILNVIIKEMLETKSSALMQIPVVRELIRSEQNASPYELFGKSASKFDKDTAVALEVKRSQELLEDILNAVSGIPPNEIKLFEHFKMYIQEVKEIEEKEFIQVENKYARVRWPKILAEVEKRLSAHMTPAEISNLGVLSEESPLDDITKHLEVIEKHVSAKMTPAGITRLKALKDEFQEFAKSQLTILPDQIDSESNYGAQMQVQAQTQTQQETQAQTQQSTQMQMQMRTSTMVATSVDNKFLPMKNIVKIPWQPWPTQDIFKARYYRHSKYIHTFQDLPLNLGTEKSFSSQILCSQNLYPISSGITGRSLIAPNHRKVFSKVLLVQSKDGIKKIMLDREDVEHWRKIIIDRSQADIDETRAMVLGREVWLALFDLDDGLGRQDHVYDESRFQMKDLILDKEFMADWAQLKLIQGSLNFHGKAAGFSYNLIPFVEEWVKKVGAKPAEAFFHKMLELRGIGTKDPRYIHSDIGEYLESLKPKETGA